MSAGVLASVTWLPMSTCRRPCVATSPLPSVKRLSRLPLSSVVPQTGRLGLGAKSRAVGRIFIGTARIGDDACVVGGTLLLVHVSAPPHQCLACGSHRPTRAVVLWCLCPYRRVGTVNRIPKSHKSAPCHASVRAQRPSRRSSLCSCPSAIATMPLLSTAYMESLHRCLPFSPGLVPGRSSFLLFDSIDVVHSISSDPGFFCFISLQTLHQIHMWWLNVCVVLVYLTRCGLGHEAQVLKPSCQSLLALSLRCHLHAQIVFPVSLESCIDISMHE